LGFACAESAFAVGCFAPALLCMKSKTLDVISGGVYTAGFLWPDVVLVPYVESTIIEAGY